MSGGGSSAVDVNFVAGGEIFVYVNIDCDGDFFLSQLGDCLFDDFRISEGGTAYGDFISPGVDDFGGVLGVFNTSSDGEWYGCGVCYFLYDVEHSFSVFDGGGNIEECEFISVGVAVSFCAFDGVAGIFDVDEVDAFYDASVLHIQTGHYFDLFSHFFVLSFR